MSPYQNQGGGSKATLNQSLNAYKRGNFLGASLLLYGIISESEVATNPIEEQAEYTLGKTLYRLTLYQASLEFFKRVAMVGRTHRYFKPTCKWLYYLSRKIPSDDELLSLIARYQPNECTKFQSETSFLRGQFHYRRGQLEEALSDLNRVKRENVLYLKATFLKGVIYARLDENQQAIDTFKNILRYTVDQIGGGKAKGSSGQKISTRGLIDQVAQGDYKRDLKYFSQLAVLNIARLLYASTQFHKALKYYEYIPIDGYFWLEALFESSWSLFRHRDDPRTPGRYHEKALGNLKTLSSPFFQDKYLPQASILKAVILYSRCEYEKATTSVEEFRRVYEPLLIKIRGYIKDYPDPVDLYNYLRTSRQSSSSSRVTQILDALFEDRELKRINAHITEMDRELKIIRGSSRNSKWSSGELATNILQTISYTRQDALNKAGSLVKKRLKRVISELQDLQGNADAIDVEIATSAQTNAKLNQRGVDLQTQLQVEASKRTPDSEHIYWPFEGEYWRDELGYYLYSIMSKCG
jgi:tetratricopeptide (TPR) repeat protein